MKHGSYRGDAGSSLPREPERALPWPSEPPADPDPDRERERDGAARSGEDSRR